MKKWQIGCLLGCLTPLMLVFLGIVSYSVRQRLLPERNRPIIIEQSALYIYNHYEDVDRIEYSDFDYTAFGLGSQVYSVTIMVNGQHEFRLNHFFHHDMEDPDFEVKAYEITENVPHLSEKSPVTSEVTLPETVQLVDRTD